MRGVAPDVRRFKRSIRSAVAQKGLLKRVGGPIRDKPLSIAEAGDASRLTKTDRMLAKLGASLNKGDAVAAKSPSAKSAKADGGAPKEVQKQMQKDVPKEVAPAKNTQPNASHMMAKMLATRAGGDTAQKGLLARVLAGRTQPHSQPLAVAATKPQSKESPVTGASVGPAEGSAPGKPVRQKLGGVFGLLSRVQKQAQGREASPEAKPASTPPCKRQRIDDSEGDMVLSGKKLDAPKDDAELSCPDESMDASSMPVPQSPDAETMGVEAASPSDQAVEQAPALPPPPPDPTCHHFLRLANILVADAGLSELSSSIGDHLKAIARSLGTPEPMLRATMLFLDPDVAIPDEIIAAALVQAFELAAPPQLEGEAMAQQALSACQGRPVPESAALPLTVQDVATELRAAHGDVVQDVPEAASARLAKLLGSAQTGMEGFCLVRSLQGKLAPSKEAVQLAVAKAVVK